jgi:predicted RNA binding protein YcfA (HicA-like mRNA interferase family)
MKVRDAIRMIERDGWLLVNQEASHRQYKHPLKKGRVTICRPRFVGSGSEEYPESKRG